MYDGGRDGSKASLPCTQGWRKVLMQSLKIISSNVDFFSSCFN